MGVRKRACIHKVCQNQAVNPLWDGPVAVAVGERQQQHGRTAASPRVRPAAQGLAMPYSRSAAQGLAMPYSRSTADVAALLMNSFAHAGGGDAYPHEYVLDDGQRQCRTMQEIEGQARSNLGSLLGVAQGLDERTARDNQAAIARMLYPQAQHVGRANSSASGSGAQSAPAAQGPHKESEAERIERQKAV